MSSNSLSEKTLGAGSWVIANRLITRVIDFFTLMVLARILEPADFGLVAIAMTFIMIIEAILDLPLAQILVREAEMTDSMFNTAFTLSILRGLIIALVVISLGFPIVIFYEDERLFSLMLFVALAPVFRGMVNPRLAIYMRKLDFRQDFIVNVSGKVIALLASVTTAIMTQSYWAIAVATVASPVTMMLVSYLFNPKWMRLSLSEWSLFKDTVSWFTLSRIISAINWQLDRILLGRYINVSSFGGYSIATNLAALPVQVFLQPLAQPIMSGFVPIKDDDQALKKAYCKANNAVFFITAPFFLTMAVLAEPGIKLVFGDKWSDAAPVLRWLAVCGFFPIVTALFEPLLLMLNKTKFIVYAMSMELCARIPLMFFGVIYYGIMGAIIANALSRTVLLMASIVIVKNMIGVSMIKQLTSFWRPLLSLMPMLIFLLFFENTFEDKNVDLYFVLNFTGLVISAFVIYTTSNYLFWLLSGKPDSIEKMLVNKFEILLSKWKG